MHIAPFRFPILVAIAVLSAAPSLAQHSMVDSLVSLGDAQFAAGNSAGAQGYYSEALDLYPASRPALLGKGKALLDQEQWGAAKDCFNTILDKDSADTEAHFYAGIAYREAGKTKAWILRKIDWGKSRDQFEWVMRHDSTYEDVLYEDARLLAYRNEYPDAIAAGHAQVRLRPDNPDGRIGLYRLYRSFVADDRSAAIAWFQQQRGPLPRLYLAEAYRRDKMLDSAAAILEDLLRSRTMPQPQSIYLSLARIAAERGELAAAESLFWTAVAEINTLAGADVVFEDVKYLATDNEWARYRELSTPTRKVLFFHAFWDARNPSVVGDTNIRIGEHFRRLVYAEDTYEYTGFRSSFNNPDQYRQLRFPRTYYLNQEFNDKGLIFVRHGTPDNVLRAAQPTDPGESWLYEATADAPRRMFHFERLNAAGNNWRLVPYPEDIALLQSLVSWDVRFADLLRDGDPSSQAQMRDRIIDESRVTVHEALASDEHTWTKDMTAFHFPFSVDAFQTDGPKMLMDISYAIPISSLAAGSRKSDGPIRSEIALSIKSEGGQAARTKVDTVDIPRGQGDKAVYMNMYRYRVPPDTYTIAMHVKPLEGNSFGNWKAARKIPLPSADLSLSDIQFLLASNVKTTLEIDGVKVLPSPFTVYNKDTPLYVYCHVYNLVRDAGGKTSVNVRYYLRPAPEGKPMPRVDPDDPGADAILLLEKTRDSDEVRWTEFGILNFADVSPGRYLLVVAVKDKKRVLTVIGQREITVFK